MSFFEQKSVDNINNTVSLSLVLQTMIVLIFLNPTSSNIHFHKHLIIRLIQITIFPLKPKERSFKTNDPFH